LTNNTGIRISLMLEIAGVPHNAYAILHMETNIACLWHIGHIGGYGAP
jgi:hypothetical protein